MMLPILVRDDGQKAVVGKKAVATMLGRRETRRQVLVLAMRTFKRLGVQPEEPQIQVGCDKHSYLTHPTHVYSNRYFQVAYR